MKLEHPKLVRLLQRAYSGEKAAAFACVGHAGSLKDPVQKAAVRQIEEDLWKHRASVLSMMQRYEIPVSVSDEVKLHVIGRLLSLSRYFIGWFMPYFFGGRLESGNVCEYFVMRQYFHFSGIKEHDEVLCEMGMKEKEHELYFLNQIRESPFLPLFEKIFGWGVQSSNDVDAENRVPVEGATQYCRSGGGELPKRSLD